MYILRKLPLIDHMFGFDTAQAVCPGFFKNKDPKLLFVLSYEPPNYFSSSLLDSTSSSNSASEPWENFTHEKCFEPLKNMGSWVVSISESDEARSYIKQ